MRRLPLLVLAGATLLMAAAAVAQPPDLSGLEQQVADTERAFARTMADRDHAAFVSFLAEETIFFNGSQPLRGKARVAESWKSFFEGPEAPFSWAPETVVVVGSGTLAHSSGPVFDPAGQRFATFNSVWRLEPSGEWKIVFDKGAPVCAEPKPAADE